MLKLHEQRLHKVVNKIRSESQTQARVYRVVGGDGRMFSGNLVRIAKVERQESYDNQFDF